MSNRTGVVIGVIGADWHLIELAKAHGIELVVVDEPREPRMPMPMLVRATPDEPAPSNRHERRKAEALKRRAARRK
jgi:hypothetical protein